MSVDLSKLDAALAALLRAGGPSPATKLFASEAAAAIHALAAGASVPAVRRGRLGLLL